MTTLLQSVCSTAVLQPLTKKHNRFVNIQAEQYLAAVNRGPSAPDVVTGPEYEPCSFL